MTESTAEHRAEALASEAAERAARLALAGAEQAQRLAVARALKDAEFEHRLGDHDRHLAQINGSQREMANSLSKQADSLASLSASFSEQTAVQRSLAASVDKQHGQAVSRRTLWLLGAGAIGAYSGLIGLLLVSHP